MAHYQVNSSTGMLWALSLNEFVSISVSYSVLLIGTSHFTVCERRLDKLFPYTTYIIIHQPRVYFVVSHYEALFFFFRHVIKTAAKIVQRIGSK